MAKDQPDNAPVVISADKGVPYEAVVKAMDACKRPACSA